MSRIVTLTTDFGQSDYDAGVLAGVVLSIAPGARVVDLTHEIARHNVLEAALMLERCTPYFPEGTIHVVVVDPGVGTRRRAIAARLGRQWFVGPDNGLITGMRARALGQAKVVDREHPSDEECPVDREHPSDKERPVDREHPADKERPEVEIVHLNRPRYWLPEVSHIFHGRDVFAPVGGHLAAGLPLAELGGVITDPVLLEIPEPLQTPDGWRGTVMHVDAFGNLSTNLERRHIDRAGNVKLRIGEAQIDGLVRAFGEGRAGDLVALFDSAGKLSVCVVNGDAAGRLGTRVGDPIEVIIE